MADKKCVVMRTNAVLPDVSYSPPAYLLVATAKGKTIYAWSTSDKYSTPMTSKDALSLVIKMWLVNCKNSGHYYKIARFPQAGDSVSQQEKT